MTFDQFRELCLSKKGVEETTPFDEYTLVMKVAGKMFALTDMQTFQGINVKVDPEYGIELRERYESIHPAFHMNKKHWITIVMDGKLKDSMIKDLINASYDLVVQKLTKSERLSII